MVVDVSVPTTENVVVQPKEVVLYRAHLGGQWECHQNSARFRLLACGRHWGKTIWGANEFLLMMQDAGENSHGFCVAPTYWHTQKQEEAILMYCPRELITEINRAERHVTLVGNRQFWFKSADNPDSLVSQGLDVLWVDEGALIEERAWNISLRPALMDKKGRGIFTGTPRGKNWYFRLFMLGQDPLNTEYKSWSFSSFTNPHLDRKELKQIEKDMTAKAYQQEVLGLFLEDVGAVFRDIDSHVQGTLETPKPDGQYVLGCDVAKHKDYTVLVALDVNGHVCGFERFDELSWPLQRKRIAEFARNWRGRLLIDSSGVGEPVYDELRQENVNVEGYKFTSGSKSDLIDNLSIMLDQGKLTYPKNLGVHGEVLIAELKAYGYTTTPGGTVQYSAPEGLHDDCVISLALAAWLARTMGPMEVGSVNVAW